MVWVKWQPISRSINGRTVSQYCGETQKHWGENQTSKSVRAKVQRKEVTDQAHDVHYLHVGRAAQNECLLRMGDSIRKRFRKFEIECER